MSALHKRAWGESKKFKSISEEDVKKILCHRHLLDAIAQLSGIPRSMKWAYGVLQQGNVIATVASKVSGFDAAVAIKIHEEVQHRVRNLLTLFYLPFKDSHKTRQQDGATTGLLPQALKLQRNAQT